LLSRIDGQTTWAALREIGGITPAEVDRYLERWAKDGWIQLEAAMSADVASETAPSSERAQSDAAASSEPAESDTAASACQSPEIDAGLDLSIELQQRILEFDASLERSYHDLLGIGRGADNREIKLAYFRLSKEYHPDRYFRRNIGSYSPRLDRIFKKLSEAYELLSDPTTRAEIERDMIDSEPPMEGAYGGAGGTSERIGADPRRRRAPEVPLRMRNLQRLRARFKVPKKAMLERQFKARQFYQSALAAGHEKRWLEAAASMRLAIAFDPANAEFKKGFADIQADVHGVRAAKLIEQADSADAQGEALKLLEEALFYKPCDVQLNRRAADLCLDLNEFDRAREYAETLCEVEPDSAGNHLLRARVFRRQGIRERASEALERAAALAPDHPDVAAEQRQQRPRGRT
jgi:curved DNA-binding protein CbpA